MPKFLLKLDTYLNVMNVLAESKSFMQGFPRSEIFNAVDPRKNLELGLMKMFEVGMCI